MLKFKLAVFGLMALFGIILLVAAFRPKELVIERTVTIAAPPEEVFMLVHDFRKWEQWSPYEKVDPAMKKTYSGAQSGKGAVYEWVGNDQAGTGRMEITDTDRPKRIVIKLDFEKPFEASNITHFTFVPEGQGTRVSWMMKGPSPLMMRVIGLFMNFDEMIGKDFETGLGSLKAVAEKK